MADHTSSQHGRLQLTPPLPPPPLPGIPSELGSVVAAGLGELPHNTFRFVDGPYFSN